jgi:dipeptidyl aminopeptidase/acylaminoacyl peptidase
MTAARAAAFIGLVLLPLLVSTSTARGLPHAVPDLPILFQTDRGGTSDIYAMDVRGRRQVLVVGGAADDKDPDWAPDGERFAFASDRDGTWQIYVTRNGGDPQQLTRGRFSNVDPVWSPDGSRIAFETNRNGNWDVYVMRANGSQPVNVSRTRANEWDPTWSPDSRRVAFDRIARRSSDLFAADVRTRQVTQLTQTREAELEPAFAPSGDRIAFARVRGRDSNIYVLDRSTGRTRQVTGDAAADMDPSWSPDGGTIVFTSSLRDGDLEIRAVSSTGGRPRNLSLNHAANDSEADWRPSARAARAPTSEPFAPESHGPAFLCGAVASTQSWPPWKVLNGGGGTDRLCGTAAQEWIRAFASADKLKGGQGPDRLEGGGAGDLFKSHDFEVDRLYGGQLTLNASHGIIGHTDSSLLDVAYPDKPSDVLIGINTVDP